MWLVTGLYALTKKQTFDCPGQMVVYPVFALSVCVCFVAFCFFPGFTAVIIMTFAVDWALRITVFTQSHCE